MRTIRMSLVRRELLAADRLVNSNLQAPAKTPTGCILV